MLNPVLFSTPAADDRVNRDGNCCHRVKEDAPIAAAIVAIVAGVETWLSSRGKPARCRFNSPAVITLVLSVFAIPVLLAISSAQSPTMYARHSLDRLGVVAPGSLSSPGALFAFVGSNIAHWIGSNVIRQWLWIMIVGTFGTVLLRPYYLVVGIPTTVIAWLMNRNDLLWAPRFFSTETLVWCITLVGFASIARTVSNSSKQMRTTVLTAGIVITALAGVRDSQSSRGSPVRRPSFVQPAFAPYQSDKKLTPCLRATAKKVSPRSRLSHQLRFSATRMIGISFG